MSTPIARQLRQARRAYDLVSRAVRTDDHTERRSIVERVARLLRVDSSEQIDRAADALRPTTSDPAAQHRQKAHALGILRDEQQPG